MTNTFHRNFWVNHDDTFTIGEICSTSMHSISAGYDICNNVEKYGIQGILLDLLVFIFD